MHTLTGSMRPLIMGLRSQTMIRWIWIELQLELAKKKTEIAKLEVKLAELKKREHMYLNMLMSVVVAMGI